MFRAASDLALTVSVVYLLFAPTRVAAVHARRAAQESGSSGRLVIFEEGQAIVNTAWEEHRERARHKPDCSHLVHEIYALAGFDYPYANSFELYTGVESFSRVRRPQPGDLIVWPGHVGIVLDPGQHSFYSSLGSGLGTDFYDSPYWVARGPARFYRYVAGGKGGLMTAAGRPEPRAEKPVQTITVPVIEDAGEPPSATQAPQKTLAKVATPVAAGSVSNTARANFEIPPSILIVTRAARPARDEITEAISELTNTSEGALRGGDLSKLPNRVVIFDELRVERVQLKKDHGWAQVWIASAVSIDRDRISLKRHHEKRRWELRRAGSGWLAFTPVERVYVPRDIAARVLAERLALLTRNGSGVTERATVLHQEAQVARVLNALFEEK